jgi:DNA-binding transcriptional LysR family regulator
VLLRSSSTEALAAAAAAGAGVAVLPCFVGDAIRGLVRLDGPGELPTSEVWVLVHRDQRRVARDAAVRAEIERVLVASRAALGGEGCAR